MATAPDKPVDSSVEESLARVNLRYPNKKSMNLLAPEQTQADYRTALLAGAVLAVLVFAFAKFAVFDRYATVSSKQHELTAMRTELTSVEKQLDGYDELEREYQAYTGMGTGVNGVPDALIVANMVSDVLGSDSNVTSMTLDGAVLKVKLDGYSLKRVGELTEDFKKQDAVKGITVSMADTSTSDSKGVSATLTIALTEEAAATPANKTAKTQ